MTRREKWRHAFAIGDENREKLTAEDEQIIDALAKALVKRRMAAPALLWLTTFKPLNVVGANMLQAGQFIFKDLALETLIKRSFMPAFEHGKFVAVMEKRIGVEKLIDLLQDYEEQDARERRKARKKKRKEDTKEDGI